MKKNRILIINHFHTNKGDAAILIGTMDALQKVIPDAEISIESSDPEITAKRTSYRAKIVARVFERKENKNLLSWELKASFWVFQSIIWGILMRFGLNIRKLFNNKKNTLLKEYEEADVVLSGGGGYIRDNSGIIGFLPIYSILLAIVIKKPVMIYAQSVGPVNTKIYKFLIKQLLNKVDLITLRDISSKEVLNYLKINKPPIYITADAAFFFHTKVQYNMAKTLLYKEGINKNNSKQLVGITFMHWHYPGYIQPESKHEKYKKIMAKVSDYMIRKFDATVVFISMNTGDVREDDICLAKEIVQNMDRKDNAKIITGEYSPEEIKDIISQMDMIVGTRFHSLIFALTCGVPAVSIMYEHKAIGIMKMLNLEKFVCDIGHLEENDLILKIDKVFSKREETKNNLEKDIPTLQSLALLNAKFLKQLIDSSTRKMNTQDYSFGLSQDEKIILHKFN